MRNGIDLSGGQLTRLRALSIQEKFRFEISEIPRAQWNGTFPVAQTQHKLLCVWLLFL